MRFSKYAFLFLFGLFFLFSSVSALGSGIPFNSTTDTWYYNQTFLISTQNPTPILFWFITMFVGLGLLILSLLLDLEHCSDILGILASVPLGAALYESAKGLDIITSNGVSSFNYLGQNIFVSMENHNIFYAPELIVFNGVLLAVSIANWYRLYLQYKAVKVEEEKPQNTQQIYTGSRQPPDQPQQ